MHAGDDALRSRKEHSEFTISGRSVKLSVNVRRLRRPKGLTLRLLPALYSSDHCRLVQTGIGDDPKA